MAKNKKPRKLTYWEKRAVINEQELQNRIKPIESEITNAYLKAQTYLTEQVHKIYNRVKNKNDFGEDELKRILNQKIEPSELVELKRLSNDLADKGLQESAKKQLNAIAAKGRITRLEDLKAKSHLVSKQIADVQLEKATDFLVEEIHESYNEATSEALINQIEPDSRIEVWNNKNYSKSAKTSQKQLKNDIAIEVWNKKEYRKTSHEFKELSTEYTKNILDSHWHGSNYSKRIWGDTNALANRLEELFTVESMTGMSEQEMAKAIANEFGRSIGVSRRLIRTEANYMANQAKLKGWRDRGVKQYMLVAVLDLRTSNICQGKDGKVFDVVEAVVDGKDGNYPPFHPWCRTVAIAYYGERSVKGNRIANDPISGKTFTIKKSDTYNDWMDMLKQLYSDEEIEQQKKKIRNGSKDLSDYRKLKTALGKENSPKSLEDYQDIKYNDSEQWEKLKDNYFVKSRIQDGRYGNVINVDKQAPHIKSTVKPGKSYFEDDVDVQELFDKYAGTGIVERTAMGKRTTKEIIYSTDFEGMAVNADGSEKTHTFKIHHSKNRTHIVPIKKRGDSS